MHCQESTAAKPLREHQVSECHSARPWDIWLIYIEVWPPWTATSNVFQVVIVKEENPSVCTVPPRGQRKYHTEPVIPELKNNQITIWVGLIPLIS